MAPPVRARMVALASRALGEMPTSQVPATLRKAATFAPAKRAKLVGNQIATAIDDDADFREHLSTQVQVLVPGVVAELRSGQSGGADEPVEAAAVAFLLRPEGWEDVVAAGNARVTEQRESQSGELAATVERLTAQLSDARGQVKSTRDKLRARVDAVKSENSQLRRTLGQTRAQLKEAQGTASGAYEAIQEARREADVAARDADAEARRLRSRIAELEGELATARRSTRDDRGAENARLRLLLET
ncbi:MAG: NYN domain-containing protein, partial [Nocardioidaceae bacterium]